jgi:hypothetical protein
MKESEGTASIFSLHRILQEALYAKCLKMTHIMGTVVNTVNFIHACAFNHHEFVALLGETEIKDSKIIYHINMRWLNRRSVFATVFGFIEENQNFRGK